ncbi:hypothetical protein D3C72_2336300 [compost metagenome]
MAGFQHHLENAAGQLVRALGRLVGVGIGAHGDGLGPVVPGRQFGAQRLHGIGLDIDVAFEIDPRRMPEIGMGRPGEAI